MFFPLVVLRKIEKAFSSHLEAPEQLIKLLESLGLYWLLQTSVRKIDSLVFHHPPLFLCHVILNHGRRREIFLLHERKALQREKRALPCSIHSSQSCKGCNRDLPNASSHMTALSGYASYTHCPIEPCAGYFLRKSLKNTSIWSRGSLRLSFSSLPRRGTPL